jgi:hypothetical protein
MFEKFSRSWQLIKASAGVLRQDKELLVFPLLSSLAAILVAATFIVPLVTTGALESATSSDEIDPVVAIVAFAFYFVQYFVIFFFNTALVGAAMIRLEGGDPTVADGLRIASRKIVPILGYAAIAATVGMILRAIEEKAGGIGKWVAGLLGAAWTVATFMVVPVLVTKDIGPIDAVKESAVLLKKTWGENLIGNGGLGVVFFLVYLVFGLAFAALFVLLGAAKSGALMLALIAVAVAFFVVLALIQTALQGIYSAALYRHATGAADAPGFDGALLANAFRVK